MRGGVGWLVGRLLVGLLVCEMNHRPIHNMSMYNYYDRCTNKSDLRPGPTGQAAILQVALSRLCVVVHLVISEI